ncbi:MAG: ABC transporter permease [Deltaproteobacteria bacterium]|nr:ABC transporter permease [Deltaproteobacteria bacterium]
MIPGPFTTAVRTAQAVARRGLSARDCLEQVHDQGNRTVALVVTALSFFGAVMVTIAYAQARKITGNLATVGPPYLELLVRDFGPLTCALLAAARCGAASAAELSAMAVNEQVEALELCNGDPYSDLVAPRFVGALVAVPLLCILGTSAAAVSAALTARYVFLTDGMAFLDPRFIDGWDLLSGGLKALLAAAWIPLAASSRGLAARGGSAAVGEATTDGVVVACVGSIVLVAAVGLLFQLLGV